MRRRHVRPLAVVVALVLVVSALVGVLVRRIIVRDQRPIDDARAFAQTGRYGEAELLFLDVARQRPVSLPAVIELLDNHQRLFLMLSITGGGSLSDVPSPTAKNLEADDQAIATLLASTDLTPDVALLARWWGKVTRGDETAEDRAPVIAAAIAQPPAAWANHLLGREERDESENAAAADHFAREAAEFDGRGEDADAACAEWVDQGNWEKAAKALAQPRFARQVSASVRMQMALARRDWAGIVRWFFPAQYDGTTVGTAVLACISAFIWFGICAQIGLVIEKPRPRLPLYIGAFGLGIVSAYVALALAIAEHALGFVEKGQTFADAIYFVVGVGLREELSKALLLLPLVFLTRRSGLRREAFACGALVGLGFAAEENLGYLHMGLSTAFARFLTANFLHMSTTGLVAVAIDDLLRGNEVQSGAMSRTLMVVVAAHGLYDFFLSGAPFEGGAFLSMFVFVWLAKRFVAVIRSLPGREGPLLRMFCIGLASVAGATFVYACTLVGPEEAAVALLEGALGLSIVTYMFVQEFRAV